MHNNIRLVDLAVSTLMLLVVLPVSAQEQTELDCLVKPEMYIDISSPVDGVLETVLVGKSDSVKKGQELARLEASVEKAKVLVAKQEAEMDNLIHSKRLRYEFAQRKKDRIANLFKGKVLSTQDFDEVATESDIAESELIQARLLEKQNRLKLSLAKAELAQKTIKSPIDGIVIERYLMPGESTENRPIMQLAKIDPLVVEVVAPASLFGAIKTGMTVGVRPDMPGSKEYLATVSIVDRIIDAASDSFSIDLALPNPDAELIGGSKCVARFDIKPPAMDFSQVATKEADDELPDDIKALLKP